MYIYLETLRGIYITFFFFFLIIHLSVNPTIFHIFMIFYSFIFCKKERLNTNLKTET